MEKNDSGFVTESAIPTKLPNPNAITFTGGASGTYDGSNSLVINIPTEGGGNTTPYGYEEVAEGAKELTPNVFYKFTIPQSTITVTLKPAEGYAEYNFAFTASASGCNLALPASIKWDGGVAPTLEANKYYEVSILNNLALISKGVVM